LVESVRESVAKSARRRSDEIIARAFVAKISSIERSIRTRTLATRYSFITYFHQLVGLLCEVWTFVSFDLAEQDSDTRGEFEFDPRSRAIHPEDESPRRAMSAVFLGLERGPGSR